MAETPDAFNEPDQIRRELRKLNDKVDGVDHKVERSRATQLGALATGFAAGDDVAPELVLASAGMSIPDIAAALGKSEPAARKALEPARQRRRKGR
jgi:hypothetical protein